MILGRTIQSLISRASTEVSWAKARSFFYYNYKAEQDISQLQKQLKATVVELCDRMAAMRSQIKPYGEQFGQVEEENVNLRDKILAAERQRKVVLKDSNDSLDHEELIAYREQAIDHFYEMLNSYEDYMPAHDLLQDLKPDISSISNKIANLKENLKKLVEHHELTIEFASLFLEDRYKIKHEVQAKFSAVIKVKFEKR